MNKRPVFLSSIGVAALTLFAAQASATSIYRWVDESGRTHVSDTVPEKYRKSAKRIDSEQFKVSAEDRTSAQERTAKDKALAEQLESQRQKEEVKAATAASAISVPKARKSTALNASDCAAWRRLYRESQACFAPYHNADGSMKPGAHENCTQVDNPELKCGVENWYQQ